MGCFGSGTAYLLSYLGCQPRRMIPSLLEIIFGIPQLAFNPFIPLFLLQESHPSFVFFGSPLCKTKLRLALSSGSLLLKDAETLKFFDRGLNCLRFSFSFLFDDLRQATSILFL